MLRKIVKRFLNRNKLSYVLNIAFGLCLLMVTLQFQFGRTIITTDLEIIKLEHGYITEANQLVRIIEGLIGIGLVALGIERLINRNKSKEFNDKI